MDITLQMNYVEGWWPQNCDRSKPTDYLTRVTQKLVKICIFFYKNAPHPKIFNVKIFRREYSRTNLKIGPPLILQHVSSGDVDIYVHTTYYVQTICEDEVVRKSLDLKWCSGPKSGLASLASSKQAAATLDRGQAALTHIANIIIWDVPHIILVFIRFYIGWNGV